MADKCPRCSSELAAQDVDGVKIDVCGGCNGIFLDENELVKVREGASKVSYQGGTGVKKSVDTASAVKCVRCASEMERVNFSYTSGIFIDHCRACGSVWLDDGELEKIAAYMSAENGTPDDAEKLKETLGAIRRESEANQKKGFRAISSGGRMGSMVNFVYSMLNKVIG